MTDDQHYLGVGKVLAHLLSLEFVLRLFLCDAAGQRPNLPEPGDVEVSKTWLTDFKPLRHAVHAYNAQLTEIEKPKFTVDSTVITLRNALAHGRIASKSPRPPFTLFKFGQSTNGCVPIEIRVEMTAAWLGAQSALTCDQVVRVVNCGKARGYESLA